MGTPGHRPVRREKIRSVGGWGGGVSHIFSRLATKGEKRRKSQVVGENSFKRKKANYRKERGAKQ